MKILICGYNFHGYLDSIAKGFIKNGCMVKLFAHPNVSIRKLSSPNPIKKIYAWYRLRKINNSLSRFFLEQMPDVVLCINASSLFPDTVKLFSKRSVSVLWLVDTLERVATDITTIEKFKKIFIFEPADKIKLKDAEFLPYGFDEEIYYKQKAEKVYDVTFVGAGHRERYAPLDKISERCKRMGIKFSVFGPFTLFKKDSSYKKRYPFLYQSLVHNNRILPQHINEIYNKTWININLHHPQSKEGVNPRTFEIAGSGNFQLTDEKGVIKGLFHPDELVTYSDVEDLTEKISYFLKEKQLMSSIAEMARKRAISEHTFQHRAKYILSAL